MGEQQRLLAEPASSHVSGRRDRGFHALAVKQVIQETSDTNTFVLDVPETLRDRFAYRPGQFCTVRATITGEDVLRCYSMSSAPGVDADLALTVKRVAGGLMSNWLLDHIAVGDTLELAVPSGVFCPGDTHVPLVAFGGGSGMTPIVSIIKHVLATTGRRVKLLAANRDRSSVIFHDEIARMQVAHAGRFDVLHHLDADSGFLDPAGVAAFVGGLSAAEAFVCGPTPFMDLVERGLIDAGIEQRQIFIERYVAGGVPSGPANAVPDGDDLTEVLTLVLKGKRAVVDYVAGDTVLDAARRAGLKPPSSCELGNCATCMAMVRDGAATMRTNNALTDAEVVEGWVLTCQAQPRGRAVTIEYESS